MSVDLVSGNFNFHGDYRDFARTFSGFANEKDAVLYLEKAFDFCGKGFEKELVEICLSKNYFRAFAFLLDRLPSERVQEIIGDSTICRLLIETQGMPLDLCKKLDGLGWNPSHFNERDRFGVTLIQKLARSGNGESQLFLSLVERIGMRNIKYSPNFGQQELLRCLDPNGIEHLRNLPVCPFRIPQVSQHGCTVLIHPDMKIQGVPLPAVLEHLMGREPFRSELDAVEAPGRQGKSDGFGRPGMSRLYNTTFGDGDRVGMPEFPDPRNTTYGDGEDAGSDLDAFRAPGQRDKFSRVTMPGVSDARNTTYGDGEDAGSDLDAFRAPGQRNKFGRVRMPDFSHLPNMTYGDGQGGESGLGIVKRSLQPQFDTTLGSLNDTTYGDIEDAGSQLQLRQEPVHEASEAGSGSFNRSHVWLRIHLAPGHGMFKIQDPRNGEFKSFGFYPAERNQPITDFLLGVPCQVRDDGNYIEETRAFNADLASQTLISAEQGMKVLKHIEKTKVECQKGTRQFHLLGNCVNYVQEIYEVAEIDGPTHFGQLIPPSGYARHFNLPASPIAMQYAMLHSYGLLPTAAAHALPSSALVAIDRPLQMVGQTYHSHLVGGVALFVGFLAMRKCWNAATGLFSSYPQAATAELYERIDGLQRRRLECEELLGNLLAGIGRLAELPQHDLRPDQIVEVQASYEQLRREWIDLSVDIEFLEIDRAPSISKSEGRRLVREADQMTARLDQIEPRIRHLEQQLRG